jgi:myo-inositol-1-phosphate synthase
VGTHRSDVVALLLVGYGGLTASAVAAGASAMMQGVLPVSYGVTDHEAFEGISLPSMECLRIGGWDFYDRSLFESLRLHRHLSWEVVDAARSVETVVMPGIATELDFPPPAGSSFIRRPRSLEEGASMVAHDIKDFAAHVGADRVVVVYLGSPSQRPDGEFATRELRGPIDEFPGSLVYALGSVLAGSDFVDFTPSFALEYRRLWELASNGISQLAGRDGSTGQTMLKETLVELLNRRGLLLDSWYSTNILGNNDGLVLAAPGYGDAKLADKMDVLPLGPERNVVDIRYMPHWGDRKESWDAAECTSWLGGTLSVRLNWRGSDSELAAPLIVDLVRLLAGGQRRSGFRPELGFFFKRPFGREDAYMSDKWIELIQVFGCKSE